MKKQTRVTHPKEVKLREGNDAVVSPVYPDRQVHVSDDRRLADAPRRRSTASTTRATAIRRRASSSCSAAELQDRDDAIAVGSGMAADLARLLGNLEAGDRVVIFVESYRPNRVAVRRFLPKLGVKFTMLSVHDLAGIEQAFAQDDTKLVLFEAPTNPMLQVPDLAAITALGEEARRRSRCSTTRSPGLHNHGRYEHRLLRAQPHEVRERPRRRRWAAS